jgi:hypothetical protein
MSAFPIAEVGRTGKRVLTWGGPLVLSANPRWRRLELRVPSRREHIALDYDRIGIDRVFFLVLRLGQFDLPGLEPRSDRGASPIN